MKFHASLAALAALAVAATAAGSDLTVDLKLVGNTEVKAVITNTGDKDIKLLKTGTILSQAPVEKALVTSNNTRVGFKGAWVRVIEQYLDDTAFQTVGAGKTIENVFDLAAMYDLSEGGLFTVQANDSISVANEQNRITGSIPYASNVLEIQVDGSKASESRTLAYADFKRAVTHCDGDRRNVVTNAMRRCRELAAAAQYEAAQGQASRMDEYFKRSDGKTRGTVSDVFRKVGEVCSSLTTGYARLYCYDVHKGCDGGAVALTYPSQSDMVLCDVYFKSIPPSNNQCHAGDQGTVLIHEATHLSQVKGTGDHGYGYDSVKKNSADVNIKHADAYTYFAKSFYESCSNSGDPNSYQVYVCKDTNKKGGCIGVRGKFGKCANLPPDFNNAVSSLGGSYTRECTVFKDTDCRGQSLKIAKGQQMNSLPAGMNDQISSVRC